MTPLETIGGILHAGKWQLMSITTQQAEAFIDELKAHGLAIVPVSLSQDAGDAMECQWGTEDQWRVALEVHTSLIRG